jgi:phosphoglycolate phosphatase
MGENGFSMNLLLFDVDATLVRTGGAGLRAMDRAFDKIMHWPGALEKISPAGRTDPSIAHEISRIQRGCNMSPEELESVFNCYLEYLAEELENAPGYRVLPGIEKFLEKISQAPDFLLGLGTGNLEAGARLKLKPAGLNRFFNFGGFGSDAEQRPEVLQIGVKQAQAFSGQTIAPGQVLVIGDTQHDVQAGQAIGARTLAVATGPYSVKELQAFQPDWVIQDFTEKALLQKVFPSLA